MKVIILAAGQGTRLRPLTQDRPKCLVELAGTSILQHQLNLYRNAGISHISVVGGYKADQLNIPGLTRYINARFATTNMVHTLFCAEDAISSDEDIIISYGDIVFEERVLSDLMKSDAEIAVVIDREWFRYWSARMDDPLSDAESLKLDSENRIIEIGKKTTTYQDINGQYIGLFKVRADKAKEFVRARQNMSRDELYDGKSFENMYMTSYLQALINLDWDVRAVMIMNGWAEIDCLKDIEVATQYWKP